MLIFNRLALPVYQLRFKKPTDALNAQRNAIVQYAESSCSAHPIRSFSCDVAIAYIKNAFLSILAVHIAAPFVARVLQTWRLTSETLIGPS